MCTSKWFNINTNCNTHPNVNPKTITDPDSNVRKHPCAGNAYTGTDDDSSAKSCLETNTEANTASYSYSNAATYAHPGVNARINHASDFHSCTTTNTNTSSAK